MSIDPQMLAQAMVGQGLSDHQLQQMLLALQSSRAQREAELSRSSDWARRSLSLQKNSPSFDYPKSDIHTRDMQPLGERRDARIRDFANIAPVLMGGLEGVAGMMSTAPSNQLMERPFIGDVDKGLSPPSFGSAPTEISSTLHGPPSLAESSILSPPSIVRDSSRLPIPSRVDSSILPAPSLVEETGVGQPLSKSQLAQMSESQVSAHFRRPPGLRPAQSIPKFIEGPQIGAEDLARMSANDVAAFFETPGNKTGIGRPVGQNAPPPFEIDQGGNWRRPFRRSPPSQVDSWGTGVRDAFGSKLPTWMPR